MARLFISQKRLDAWSAENRVSVQGSVMTLEADGRAFEIAPAVLFSRVSGDEEDPNGLVGTVVPEADLEAMGADLYMTSVIYKETAYDVVGGFLGRALPRARAGAT